MSSFDNLKLKQQEKLEQWINEQHTCEKCGKVMTEKFGSGRFCCRGCANSRNHSTRTKVKISNSINQLYNCECKYCQRKFKTLVAKGTHEAYCDNNPNKVFNTSGSKKHEKTLTKQYITRYGDVLNVTNGEVEEYLKYHKCCEICGKTINEVNQSNPNFQLKRLCVDHDHITNTFRGVLCPVCNRQLGWYEKNRKNIENYLDKNSK